MEICPITQLKIKNSSRLLCKHTFESDAIDQWLKYNDTCPMCRKKVKNTVTFIPWRFWFNYRYQTVYVNIDILIFLEKMISNRMTDLNLLWEKCQKNKLIK